MSTSFFSHTDEDGDTLEAAEAVNNPYNHVTVLSAISDDNNYVSVGLTADAARDLAAKLTEWVGEPVRITEEMNPDHNGQVGTVRGARIHDVDGEGVTVQTATYDHRPDIVVCVHDDRNGSYHDFDREGAVALITALADAVEAHDAREAAEARKLKRGDVVTAGRTLKYTVISDETDAGRVDVVSHRYGHIYSDRLARTFTRIHPA